MYTYTGITCVFVVVIVCLDQVVLKSFKVPDIEVVAARMTDSTPKNLSQTLP